MIKPNSLIHCVPAFKDNYIWLISEPEMKTVLCVDPGEAAPVLEFLQNSQQALTAILLTHHHADHCAGVPELLGAFPQLRIYGALDPRITYFSKAVISDSAFVEAGHTFQVLTTPGHTGSHRCFYEPNQGWVFTGDTLFSAGCGRIFDGSAEHLFNSLQQLKALADETLVFCGHEYTENNLRFASLIEPNNSAIFERLQAIQQQPTRPSLPSNIGLEKAINPFFRLESEAVIQYAMAHGCGDSSPLAVFACLRKQKDVF